MDYLAARVDGRVVDLQYVFHEITTQLMGNMAYNVSFPSCADINATYLTIPADGNARR